MPSLCKHSLQICEMKNTYQPLWFDLLLEPEVTRLLDLMTSKMSRNVLSIHTYFLFYHEKMINHKHVHSHTLTTYHLHFIRQTLKTKT